ncbi:MAG: acyl-CoA synthetase [Dehalococcoidia bacterium]|nr:acyl-CoA synthetase [Dehalococcoidia bacterium]
MARETLGDDERTRRVTGADSQPWLGQPWLGNPPLNLARWCIERHALDPAAAARPALSFVDAADGVTTWTYAEVWAHVQRIARGLRARGLATGERVLVRLPHSPEYAFAFMGATLAGLVPIPVSPMLTEGELRFLLQDTEAAAVIGGAAAEVADFRGVTIATEELARLDGTAALPETHAEDPAYILYTSGTTDRPKGAAHAHRSVYGRAMMRAWQDFRPTDVTFHPGTLNWMFTLGTGLMDPWAAGAHAVLASGPAEPARWPRLIRELGVTIFIAVPTVYRQMLKYATPEEIRGRLRHVLCAGEPLLPTLLEEWRTRVGTEMYEALGMTEMSTYISTGPGVPIRPGSAGRPQPGRRVAILPIEGDSEEPLPPDETGLLAVHRSDPGLMLGYWRRPAEQAAVIRGEWFIGGDLCSMDADGYVWFRGRADDVIKSFGYRLSPLEIEKVIDTFPAIAEACVVPHRIDDQRTLVTACVVARDGTTIDRDALARYVEARLAEYKRPHEYVVMESLPRTRNGKVLRRELVAQLERG